MTDVYKINNISHDSFKKLSGTGIEKISTLLCQSAAPGNWVDYVGDQWWYSPTSLCRYQSAPSGIVFARSTEISPTGLSFMDNACFVDQGTYTSLIGAPSKLKIHLSKTDLTDGDISNIDYIALTGMDNVEYGEYTLGTADVPTITDDGVEITMNLNWNQSAYPIFPVQLSINVTDSNYLEILCDLLQFCNGNEITPYSTYYTNWKYSNIEWIGTTRATWYSDHTGYWLLQLSEGTAIITPNGSWHLGYRPTACKIALQAAGGVGVVQMMALDSPGNQLFIEHLSFENDINRIWEKECTFSWHGLDLNRMEFSIQAGNADDVKIRSITFR
jgi:hypothetical protein